MNIVVKCSIKLTISRHIIACIAVNGHMNVQFVVMALQILVISNDMTGRIQEKNLIL